MTCETLDRLLVVCHGEGCMTRSGRRIGLTRFCIVLPVSHSPTA
jgi:hypothetical protein